MAGKKILRKVWSFKFQYKAWIKQEFSSYEKILFPDTNSDFLMLKVF